MTGEVQDNSWPLPKFFFTVDISGVVENLAFQEVGGLDEDAQVLEYRAGNSAAFEKVKMLGMVKSGNVTLKKGVLPKDNAFFDWMNRIRMNTIERRTVTIKLLDEEGSPTMVWTLANAFPVKVSNTDLRADRNEVAVEAIELAHEGITMENG